MMIDIFFGIIKDTDYCRNFKGEMVLNCTISLDW